MSEVVTAPTVFGYIFGHEHAISDGFLHDGRQVVFWYDKPGNFYKA